MVPENVYELQFTGACKKHIINMNSQVIYVMEIDVNIVFPMDFSRLLTKTFWLVIITDQSDQSFSCKEQNHLDHIDVSESAVSFLLMLFRFPFDSNDCKFRISPFTFHDYKVASSNIYNICNDHHNTLII